MASDAFANDYVVNASAVVARWRSRGSDNTYLGHGHPEASCQAALDIQFQRDERKAFVKLRVPVGIKAATRKIYVYFFIHPEHILSLDRFDCNESEDRSQATIPEQVQSALVRSKQCSSSESITGLKFSLSKPGALVVPVDTALAPKTKASGNILDALYSLGRATTVTLYVPTPRISDSRQLDLLCSSASGGALKSIKDACSLAMLYHGSGGRVIEHLDDPLTDTDPLANDDATFYAKADSPPSYDEISLTPPPHRRAQRHREQPPSKKTKVRSQAASSRAHHIAKTGSLAQEWKRTVDDQLQALAADVKAMREEMRSTQAARRTSPAQGSAASTASQESSGNSLSERMDRTERAIEALRAQVEQSEKRFEERLLEVAERVTAEAEQRVREGLEDDLQDVRDATSEQTDVKIEESFLNMKDEMREYIAEELKAVEDVLKDSIRGAVLSIDID
ncbi:hypothetical protein SLS56_005441 [Neofusicoccum ribis]|uniref:Uncharacterized protein n=1 Tax=Neofusicoccum ribis TaxID=45134 RepID=A0ABR3STD7_9PEZI